jgi:hypothetical protein
MQLIELAAAGMEIAIATLMLLFAGFLLAGSARRSVPAYSLATITGLIGIQVLLSALGGQEQLQWLRVIRPPLALLIAPAVFIYVSQVRQDAETLAPGILWHALPALGIVILIAAGADQIVDNYLNLCIGGYWIASLISFMRHRPAYRPPTVEPVRLLADCCLRRRVPARCHSELPGSAHRKLS